MDKIKVFQVKQSVFANNDEKAAELRKKLKEEKVFLLNLMSSPGSGKTTLLVALLNKMKEKVRIGVMEADIDATVDAETIASKTGVKTIQLHTSGECHLDAEMTKDGIDAIGCDGLDFLILENIGNLVCPAEFDTGAHLNAEILSVPEGDDKPLKYPLMFKVANLFIISKMDTISVFNFDVEKAKERIKKINPNAVIFPVSAKSGEGIDELADYLLKKIEEFQK